MHRSRSPMLVIAIAVAACSSRKEPSDAATSLSKDSTLAARLDGAQRPHEQTDKQPYPDACGTVSIPDQPTAANKTQAAQLNRQAYDAEMLGNIQEASSLLHRASSLDWTDKSAAYHLGRVSESLGDRTAAIQAYCRYLALAPSVAEGADARQRVATLAQGSVHTAGGSIAARSVAARVATTGRTHDTSATTTSHATKAPASRIATVRTTTQHPIATSPTNGTAPARQTARTQSVATSAVADAPSQTNSMPTSSDIDRPSDGVASVGDTVSALPPLATASQSPTPPRTDRHGPSSVQGAGIGAVAGAIIGGMAGRSVKSAAIGAAAGGVFGAIAARGTSSSRARDTSPLNLAETHPLTRSGARRRPGYRISTAPE